MWRFLLPLGLIGFLFLSTKESKAKEGTNGKHPFFPRENEIWSIGVRTSHSMREEDWLEFFQTFTGQIIGVTEGVGKNEYVVTVRFGEDTQFPPVGYTHTNPDGSTVKLIFMQQAPAG